MSGNARRSVRTTPLIVGIVLIALAFGLGAWITWGLDGGNFAVDVEWAAWLAAGREPVLLTFSYVLNWLGGGAFAIWVVPLGTAALLVLLRRPWSALFFVVAELASSGLVQLLKNLFARARPEDMIVHSDFGSFPSGHVANAATIAVAVAVIWPHLAVRIAGVLWVLAMAFSRTYLGAHWLTDTLGGALVGAGVVLVLAALMAPLFAREREKLLARRGTREGHPVGADPRPVDQNG